MPAVQCSTITADPSATHVPATTESSARVSGSAAGACPRRSHFIAKTSKTAPTTVTRNGSPMFCLKNSGTEMKTPAANPQAAVGFFVELLQQPKRNQNPERAVAVVLRIGHDAVDSHDRKRRGDEQRHRPCGRHAPAQRFKCDTPGNDRPQPSNNCDVQHMMEENAAREANDGRLNEEGERRVRQGKVAVRHLALGDARRGVENVAEIEQDCYVRVLPQHHACCGRKERNTGNAVAQTPHTLRRANGARRSGEKRHGAEQNPRIPSKVADAGRAPRPAISHCTPQSGARILPQSPKILPKEEQWERSILAV